MMYAVFRDGQQIWEPSANRQKLMAWIMRTIESTAAQESYDVPTSVKTSKATDGCPSSVSAPASAVDTHDDKPPETACNMAVAIREGDLDLAGRPLRPGS